MHLVQNTVEILDLLDSRHALGLKLIPISLVNLPYESFELQIGLILRLFVLPSELIDDLLTFLPFVLLFLVGLLDVEIHVFKCRGMLQGHSHCGPSALG